MSQQTHSIGTVTNSTELSRRVQRHLDSDAVRLQRLWDYYRNPLASSPIDTVYGSDSDRPYRQAQEWGLPARITGVARSASNAPQLLDGISRKEVVIENDIGWRIDTIVDYLFGKSIVINSGASDPNRRAIIEKLLRLILAQSGGIIFLQQLALLGAVYGFVDVLVKFDSSARTTSSSDTQSLGEPPAFDELPTQRASDSGEASALPPAESASGLPDFADAALTQIAQCIRLEVVEPTRALPFLDSDDYRNVQAYAQVYLIPARSKSRPTPRSMDSRNWFERIFPRFFGSANGIESAARTTVVEFLTPTTWQRFEDEKRVDSGANSLGELPLVHIQNSAVPFEYAGGSDVAPLLALQDELNTRLSDRAYRITMQSFKMYLGKGIENFGELPIAPGRMWMTENESASVQEFGGDSESPSEDNHIREIREAMDKTSSVTPIAAGATKDRIGNLTSAAALRVTLTALIAKTERKRILYGEGIKRMCELALAWLDRAGLFRTTPDERRIELNWPTIVPLDESDRLAQAQSKLNLGVPRDVVLRELGYESH